MDKKEFFKKRIDKIAKENFNADQKQIAKKIIDNSDENDLEAVWELISQRVKTGFVFDKAPEINHNCVAYIKENQKLGINLNEKNANEHSLIIGENYDALKNLIATYTDKNGKGLIDVIYIDPPYNTDKSKQEGNDYKEEVESKNKFIYRDKYTRDGWLNMMNERLKLAKKLLSDNGVIFISIDDKEQAYLKVLCDEIFGENNFITNFKWNRVAKAPSLDGTVRTKYEYVIAYFNKNHFKLFGKKSYNKQGPLWHLPNKRAKLIFPANSIRVKQSFKAGYYGGTYEVELENDLIEHNGLNKDDVIIYACSSWAQKTINEYIEDGFTFEIKKSPTTMYTDIQNDKYIAPDDLINKDCGVKNNTDANTDIKKMGLKFDYSKPVSLIKYLIRITEINDKKDTIVLDFFAGSGTTGQAVMEMNEEDGGNRKFIIVTNNENNIAKNITRERLFRVINGKGSKGEEFEWSYSKDKKCLQNNSLRVFDIAKEELNISDIEKAEKIRKEAELNFEKINQQYLKNSNLNIYSVLASLTPYKEKSED